MRSGLLWLGFAGLLVASYVARQLLPAPKPRIIGIDLGTTYSCVGVYHSGTGHVEILQDQDGRRVLPSVVYYDEDGRTLVGRRAQELALARPPSVVFQSKRFMGRAYAALPPADSDRFPFRIVNASGRFAFELPLRAGPAIRTPEEVASVILAHLKGVAEARLAQPVHRAVLAVPADFTAAQRNATQRAGMLAGLDVVRIINEPTAAAMAYGLHKRTNVDLILVFDFGGGTLDVSLLSVHGGMFSTLAIAGNTRLGGEDFSHRLFAHVLSALAAAEPVDAEHPLLLQAVRASIEAAKIALSTHERTTVRFPILASACKSQAAVACSQEFFLQIERSEFESMCEDLFAKVLAPVRAVLREAEEEPASVDEVVLVGGSTRIPKVRALLAAFFGREPNTSVDADEAVATGIAIQAGIVGGAWPLQVSAIEIPFDSRRIDVTD